MADPDPRLPLFDAGQVDLRVHAEALSEHARTWTQSGLFARLMPDRAALVTARGWRSFAQLHENANRLAHVLKARGFAPGDALALLCGNRAEFVEVFLAAMRSGLRLTPINTHLHPQEVQYIVHDCGARLLIVEEGLDAPAVAPALSLIHI